MEAIPCVAATAALIAILTGLARGSGRSTGLAREPGRNTGAGRDTRRRDLT